MLAVEVVEHIVVLEELVARVAVELAVMLIALLQVAPELLTLVEAVVDRLVVLANLQLLDLWVAAA
jgi:hypothetical protein